MLNKRTAVTRSVAKRLVRSGVRTNPHALAEEFLEDKYEALASLQACCSCAHTLDPLVFF